MLSGLTFALGLIVGIALGVTVFRRAPKDPPSVTMDVFTLADSYDKAAHKQLVAAQRNAEEGLPASAEENMKRADYYHQRAEELRRKALES